MADLREGVPHTPIQVEMTLAQIGEIMNKPLADERDRYRAERDEWKARCRALVDPDPGGLPAWNKALREAREALEGPADA